MEKKVVQPEPVFERMGGHGVMLMDVPLEKDIIEYQWHMLQDSPVKGLLPVSCLQREGRVTLAWRVTSLQPLSLMFERQALEFRDLVHLIRQLHGILSRLEERLLEPESLLLDNRHIMVDPVNFELSVAYVPFSMGDEDLSPVRKMIQQWLMGECRIKGETDPLLLSGLVTLLGNPSFHWSGLEPFCRLPGNLPDTGENTKREQVSVLAIGSTDKQSRTREKELMNCDVVRSLNEGRQKGTLDAEVQQRTLESGERLEMKLRVPWENKERVSKEDTEMHLPKGTGWRFWVLQVLSVLVIVITLGSGIPSAPDADGISAWLGMTLVVGAMELFAFRLRVSKPEVKTVPVRRPGEGLRHVEGESLSPDKSTEADHTVLLNEGTGFFLAHVQLEGKQKVLELPRFPYLMGRLRGQVDACLEHPTVGKIHAEIRMGESGPVLIDLNSRNGTTLNGKRLVPYQPGNLHAGDVIGLAAEELVFSSHAHSEAT